ncbi:MAG: hypothetical protein KAT18_06780 [Candidatus Latescibacteria bacterium]|nr:hypothetical protein [Candidatus Latescibacterota bacterium]
MRKHTLFILAALVTASVNVKAQQSEAAEPYREYRFMFGTLTELDPIATAGLSLNRAVNDIYFSSLEQLLPEKIRPVSEIVWSVFWTFTFTMWPHDGGHWARAQQIGGNFLIHGYSFPFPEAEMKLPSSLEPGEGTLTSTGGFEINYLMSRRTRMSFYRNGWGHADDLIHSLIQETHFPFYAFLLTPADPTDPETWTETIGDPVECVLSVYEDFTGLPAIRTDGSVDPDLVRQYREAVYLSLLGVACDLWDQDLYGKGAALSLEADYRLSDSVGLILSGTWKDRGYVIGKRIGNCVTLLAGFSYRF